MVPIAISLLLIAAGGALTIAVARGVGGGRVVMAIMAASYALRVSLAVALYVISAWHLPVFTDLHIEDGFWRFARDTQGYHYLGMAVADSVRWGTELPNFLSFGRPDWFLIVGFLYRVIGAHPLYVPLLNAVFCSGILALVYGLARSLNGHRAGLFALAGVAAWPSLYLWSAQLLKDPLTILLTLGLLAIVAVLIERRLPAARTGGLLVAATAVALVLAGLRYYLVVFVVGALGGAVLLRCLRPSDRSRAETVAIGGACAALMIATLVVSLGTYTSALLEPANPRAGHLRKAQYLEARGELEAAKLEYARASGQLPAPLRPLSAEQVRHPVFPEGTLEAVSRLTLSDVKGITPPFRTIEPPAAGPLPAPPAPVAGDTPPVVPAVETAPPPARSRRGLQQILRDGWEKVVWVVDVRELRKMQTGFLQTYRGAALAESQVTGVVRVQTASDIVAQLPRAVAAALWAPFPWQWFAAGGDTGVARYLAIGEMILIVLLTPWILVGIVRALRAPRPAAWLLVGFAVAAAVGLGSIVGNVGILFRLRLQFLFPLLIVAAAYAARAARPAPRAAAAP